MRISVEHIIRIFDDDTGESIEVGPDSDGLDLIEIRRQSKDGKVTQNLILHPDEVKHVAEALLEKC